MEEQHEEIIMVRLNDTIKKAIFNTFELNDSLSDDVIHNKIQLIDGLPKLFKMLSNEKLHQKLIMESLELVTTKIRTKPTQTPFESTFLTQIDVLIDQPQYNHSNNSFQI